MKRNIIAAVASLLLLGAAGCDLAVDNPNAPDRDQALVNPGDVEALIAGSWWSWYLGHHNHGIALTPILSAQAFAHSAWPANFGQVAYSSIPRTPTRNLTSDADYVQLSGPWTQSYRAVAAANEGLRALNSGAVELGVAERRARAFAHYMQGVGHASIAMLYEQGPVVDETSVLVDAAGNPVAQPMVDHIAMLQAALGFFDKAIAIASEGAFHEPIPYSWIITQEGAAGDGIDAARFIQMAHSWKAMARAGNPRTPAEASAINWQAVLDDINKGVTSDVLLQFDGNTRWHGSSYYRLLTGGWTQMAYFVHGMADTSGRYQQWMSVPISERHPNMPAAGGQPERPFHIFTPDLRYPQGATLAAQTADVRSPAEQRFIVQSPVSWARDDRGIWRWSYYRDRRHHATADNGTLQYIGLREQRLLAAEAHFRLGNLAQAAAIVNETRTAAGLNATDASGVNTSCVPRLPNGQCGDLWEMLKWERRMIGFQIHYMAIHEWFDSRRWGDLMEGTNLTWPVPCRDAFLEGMECQNFGGTLAHAAPVGTYGY